MDLICDLAEDEKYLDIKTLYTSATKGICYENVSDIGKKEKQLSMKKVIEELIE